jgi:hypothetical protein
MSNTEKKNNAIKINDILNDNELNELIKSLKKRHCLNDWNLVLIYLYHIFQTAGILITSIATGYNYTTLIWVGIGLNLLASLINAFEKTNLNISKKLFANIEAIKNGTFLDANDLADPKYSKNSNHDDKNNIN